MLVSVLSALARLKLDPWAETADLARLPQDAAIRRLASLITKLPQDALVHLDLSAASVRLIALLPRLAGPRIIPNETSRRTGAAVTHPRPSVYIMVVVMVTVFGIQYLYSNHQISAPPSRTRTPVRSVSSKSVPRGNAP